MKRFFASTLLLVSLLSGCSSPETTAVVTSTTGNSVLLVSTAGTSESNPLTIYATNQSPLPASRFEQMQSDIQLQLNRDFSPVWQIWGKIIISSYTQNVIGYVVSDTIVFPTYQGTPVHSYSLYNTAWDNYNLAISQDPTGGLDSADCSHELLQRLVLNSPYAKLNIGICDACGGNGYSPTNSSWGNEGFGIQTLSDFSTPAFQNLTIPGGSVPLQPDGKPYYDFCNQLTATLTPLPGGQLIYEATQSN